MGWDFEKTGLTIAGEIKIIITTLLTLATGEVSLTVC